MRESNVRNINRHRNGATGESSPPPTRKLLPPSEKAPDAFPYLEQRLLREARPREERHRVGAADDVVAVRVREAEPRIKEVLVGGGHVWIGRK